MRKLLFFSVFALVFNSLSAQKNIYDANVEVRNLTGYNAIKVSGGIDLYISYGDEAVAVSAKDVETRNHIKTEVSDGVLKIWYEWKDRGNVVLSNNKQLKAYVSYKTLKALSGAGGSDISVDGTINTTNLSLSISAGSDFKGKVLVEKLSVDASGGSDVSIEGKASSVEVDASGGSDFNGFGLVVETAKLDASGGCDIELTVNGSVVASASGGSDIRYKGTANSNATRSSGASSVKKVGR